ncbi:MAG: ATP-binding cassette domain-containing protein [Chitinispirillia bacterium]|nr:ATP-binding cassette domain-containing protein [Chitinispirillia bacterium]
MFYKLELQNVSFNHKGGAVLDGVNLKAAPGDVVSFGGASGGGKSALLEICAGLLRPTSGSVLWDGEDICGLSKYDLYDRRKNIGYLFQTSALISNHSVFDNIALPLRCGTDLKEAVIKDKVNRMMEELSICEAEKAFPEALSAAQLKCAALARALINEPALLLLDEPLSGVDPVAAQYIIDVLYKEWQRKKMCIIMASHSLSAWPQWSGGRFVLNGGSFEKASEQTLETKVRNLEISVYDR